MRAAIRFLLKATAASHGAAVGSRSCHLDARYRTSVLLQPKNVLPYGDECQQNVSVAAATNDQEPSSLCKSNKLLQDNGVIKVAHPGSFIYLPLGLRSLEKLEKLVDVCMRSVGAQKVLLPTLNDAALWEQSGRLRLMEDQLLFTKDRSDRCLVFNPTQEEAITKMLADFCPLSSKNLPLRLYQVSSKFRDEMRAKYGLIRSREFIMKDLYTFDADQELAIKTYAAVTQAYKDFFKRLDVPDTYRVMGDSGDIGGYCSHEYHFTSNIGEDTLMVCSGCHRGNNVQVDNRGDMRECEYCGGHLSFVKKKGIEVAHTFLLGEKYSSCFGATWLDVDSGLRNVHMGCYGIGLSRLLAACVEVLSTEKQIRWPQAIAPFSVCVISPKSGSRQAAATEIAEGLYDRLSGENGPFEDDVILDDRDKLTVGGKLREAYKIGYPYVVLFGKECVGEIPKVELHCLVPNSDGPQVQEVYLDEIEMVLQTKSCDASRSQVRNG